MTPFCGLELRHPIINGSGCFDAIAAERAFGRELLDRFPFSAYVSKTITLRPREGNPPPRLWEAAAGLVNSIGLPNRGLEGYLEHDLPQLARLPVPLVTNVMGSSVEEFAALVEALQDRDEVAAIELNVSCPNVESGCISIGTDAGETRALVERCRGETDVPVLAKLSPSVSDVAAIATAAAEGGAHGLVLINTVRGIAIDRDRLQPLLGGGGGGLSGPAIKPVALHAIFHARAATGLPIIGMGGVASAQDCIEFLAAGASLVGIGTSLFAEPGLPPRMLPELARLMLQHGADAIGDLVGIAHPQVSSSTRA